MGVLLPGVIKLPHLTEHGPISISGLCELPKPWKINSCRQLGGCWGERGCTRVRVALGVGESVSVGMWGPAVEVVQRGTPGARLGCCGLLWIVELDSRTLGACMDGIVEGDMAQQSGIIKRGIERKELFVVRP